MPNLLHETILALKLNGKMPSHVMWVGSLDGKYTCTWRHFTEIANFDYGNRSDVIEVASDLVVVGRGWWLARESDKEESWVFRRPQETPEEAESRNLRTVFTRGATHLLGQIHDPFGVQQEKQEIGEADVLHW